jgi:hypothetical protein
MIHGAHRMLPTAGASSNNHVRVELIGTKLAIGSPRIVPGAMGFLPGQGNMVEALVWGATGDGTPGTFLAVDSSAEEPSNRVVIIGSSNAFERTNEALDSPGDEFFSPDSK